MCTFARLAFSVLLCERVLALSIDQRQTGDLNVQIDFKNFKFFALTKGKEEYVDYDYAYDYSEMTIKPQNGTTSTTIKPLVTETAVLHSKENTTVTPIHEVATQIIANASIITEVASTETNTDSIAIASTTTVTTTSPETLNSTTAENNNGTMDPDCKKGFFRDGKGNCQLKLQNPSNILLKMLQQKSKSSGRNGVRKA